MIEIPDLFTFAGVTFVIATLIIHILVWQKYGSKAFWVSTDYVWLIIALLGMIAATGDVRRLIAQSWIDEASIRVNIALKMANNEAEFEKIRIDKNFVDDKMASQDMRLEAKRVSQWFADALASLKGPSIKWLNFLQNRTGAEISSERFLSEPQNTLVRMLQDSRDAEVVLQKFSNASERSSTELAMSVLSPILLGLAIAIRIGKVSAQLRGLC